MALYVVTGEAGFIGSHLVEVFNVACGASWTLYEVIDLLREIIGAEGNISYGPSLSGDVPKTLAVTQKAKNLLSYEPRVDAREGLARTVACYRDAALA